MDITMHDVTSQRPLPKIDPGESVSAIKNQDEAIKLLKELRRHIRFLERAYKSSIRREDALPVLRRCVSVIEKAAGCSHQHPQLPINGSASLAQEPEHGSISTQGHKRTPRLSTRYLKERLLKKQKHRRYRHAIWMNEAEIHGSERLALLIGNERTVQERKEELQELFDRVDSASPSSKHSQTGVLQEVSNQPKMPRTSEVLKPRGIVTETKTTPRKGYELPQGNLFTTGGSGLLWANRTLERIEHPEKDRELVVKDVEEVASRLREVKITSRGLGDTENPQS